MIEFQNVSFSYANGGAGVRGVDLRVESGQCVVLCGRSGCGKTTLTRLVNGLAPQFFPGELTGRVLLDGEDLSTQPIYRIAERVGSVFQNPRTQFFNVDAESEIAFGLENEGTPREQMRQSVARTAKDLAMEPLLGRSLFALSGGEKQKIAFASVYAMRPRVYVLDEPSSNLDMRAVDDLRRNLERVKAQGATILIAEHRLFYLANLADRVVYLEEGCVAGDFSAADFRALPAQKRHAMGLRATDLREESPADLERTKMPSLWELNDVAIRRNKRDILRNVSFRAAPGEVIAVAGPNGAGKTTFVRALCGLMKEADGEYRRDGKNQSAKERMRRAYLVMQDVNYQLFAESVREECTFGLKRPDESLADQTLEELSLGALRDRHPNTLSGGQKQRLAAAAAMVSGKEVLVFDEPTSGLDYDSMARFAALVRRLAEENKLVFVVAHDYEFVLRTCTRVLQFKDGTLADDFPINAVNMEKLRELFEVK